jgi:uncharacterized repeat protein (TIGR01451 family)
MTVTKSHTGSFTQGGTGSYTITAKNVGTASSSGTVTVTDTLPTGLTATALSGTGWTCTLTPSLSCTRSDALAANASYPNITLAVNVAANAPASVTNSVTVAGGGETNTSNDTATDPTTISASGVPDMTITKSHTGNFTQGGTGSYSITAKNVGTASSSGTVTVTDTLPTGLTATALYGTGWTCTLTPSLGCTRSDALAANASYPNITLAVNVASNAPSSLTNSVTVAGGGETNTTNDTATDPTTINNATAPDMTITKSHTGNFTQGGTGSYTISAKNVGTASSSGTVTVTDTLPTGLTATALSGTGWTCTLTPSLSCTRSDALAANASYPNLTLAVNVASNAPSSVTNSVTVAGGGETNTSNDTATDPTTINTASSTPVSDDFHVSSLNSRWTFVNPQGDGSFRLTGTHILLNVPGGTNHDPSVGGNNSIRIVEAAPNSDFEVEAKFDTLPTLQYTNMGVLVQQDATNYLRFEIYSDGTRPLVYAATIVNGTQNALINSAITPSNASYWIRVTHTGNSWTLRYSIDGTTFTVATTFTQALTVSLTGPYAANFSTGTAPAFTAAVDYFFNTASPISPEDGGVPGITSISVSPSLTTASVQWTTSRAATGQVNYGLTASYGSSTTLNTTLLTNHAFSLTGLTCGTVYHYSVFSSDAGGANPVNSPDATFSSGACATGGPVSDNFDSPTLNSIWAPVNPLNDGTISVNGTSLLLTAPAGTTHDVWTGGNNSVRVMQSISNVDFEVEVKFRSVVASQYQFEGLIVEQDANNYLRFDILQADCQTAVFSAVFSGGNPTVMLNRPVSNGTAFYVRLKRAGNTWTYSYSYDALRWTLGVSFTATLNVARIGPFVGNNGANGGPAPGFTATVDYFANRAAPPATVDGQPFPTTYAPPAITYLYGSNQTFGQNGVPQQWVNVLGNVSAGAGLSTLTYSLNGGAEQALWWGENAFRLVGAGDFNVEIDYASLQSGANTVRVTATDLTGAQTAQSMTVNYVAGVSWPKTYSINWSTAGNIQNVAQIVDGQWQIQNGTVRTTQTGYDRLITLGDRTTWTDYEVLTQITIHSLSCHDFGVGVVTGWQGHTTLQYGVPLPDQPRTGHPFPGLGWYSMENAPNARRDIYCNTNARPETVLIQDASGATLQLETTYSLRFRTQRNTSGGSHYSLKIWPTGSTEPTNWDLQVDGELNTGSIVLGAHRADVSFGPVTVTGL